MTARRALALLSLYTSATAFNVTLLGLSSGSDVSVMVEDELLQSEARAAAERSVPPSACSLRPALGYVGFELDGRRLRAGDAPRTERALLQLFGASVPAAVMAHARDRIEQLVVADAACVERVDVQPGVAANASIAAACEAASADDPIIPSTDDAPMYDPDGGDDGGCFVTMQSSNNCYNYGTDVLTNSFAQPGVGSGQAWWPKEGATPTVAADEVTPLSCPPWCGPANNCSALAAAAARDGLSWHGNVMPTDEPERGGHHVALFVWPESNFHWIRMDADVDAATGLHLWSHKPGGSPVTNVDNNGDAITDPRAADFSPWTEFCGFMSAKPSEVTVA